MKTDSAVLDLRLQVAGKDRNRFIALAREDEEAAELIGRVHLTVAVAAADPGQILAALRSEAAGEYRLRVANGTGQAVFQDGWLNRAYA